MLVIVTQVKEYPIYKNGIIQDESRIEEIEVAVESKSISTIEKCDNGNSLIVFKPDVGTEKRIVVKENIHDLVEMMNGVKYNKYAKKLDFVLKNFGIVVSENTAAGETTYCLTAYLGDGKEATVPITKEEYDFMLS